MKIRPIESKDYVYIAAIYNYYVENSNAAFPEEKMDVEFVEALHGSALPDSFLVVDNGQKVIGFCLLKPFLAIENFNRTASVSYFIAPEYTRSGVGSLLINELIRYANEYKIDNFMAVIASDNIQSIRFHTKQGFQVCGTFNKVGYKKNKDFSLVYMQKYIQ